MSAYMCVIKGMMLKQTLCTLLSSVNDDSCSHMISCAYGCECKNVTVRPNLQTYIFFSL